MRAGGILSLATTRQGIFIGEVGSSGLTRSPGCVTAKSSVNSKGVCQTLRKFVYVPPSSSRCMPDAQEVRIRAAFKLQRNLDFEDALGWHRLSLAHRSPLAGRIVAPTQSDPIVA
jgi:hypothetical protein